MRYSSLFLASLLVQLAQAADEPFFPAPPRLAISAKELAELKKSPDFARKREEAVKAAEALLAKPLTIPHGWGNWVFYYACPDDGTSLVALSETEHQCPRCKKIHKDERTVAAYRTILHDRANAAALQLGWAYAFSGDDRYAREVQRILRQYANDYRSYPARRDRWGRNGLLALLGGRRYSQSLDEAVGVIALAKAYDLTRSSAVWSSDQRKHVEEDFFRATAQTLLYANRDINNHQTWYNAGLMAIASVLGDKELVGKVLTMRGGYRDQLARSVGRDGLWYEGTMAYHNYALQAMIEIVNAGRRLGLQLHEEPAFRRMIEAPLRCAYPNGQYPAMNDSDPATFHNFAASFLWAWQTYHEPKFAQAYAAGDVKRLRELLGPDAQPAPFLETKSLNLPDAGLAILRQGTGKDAVCVMLDHGPHGGAHGHFDKLNIVLFANGREWLLDPGRLTYSHKEYHTWVKQTAAHNTVTLGGKSQQETTGKLLWFQDDACCAESDDAYAGAKLRRSLYLNTRFLLDVFEVEAPAATQIDLLAHALSDKLEPVTKLGPGVPCEAGKEAGYQHLTGGRCWTTAEPSQWDFVAGKDLRLRQWLVGSEKERLLATTGIGYHVEQKVPCLIRRVDAKTATFATVYDLSGTGTEIRSVRRLAASLGERGHGWVIDTSSGRWTVRFGEKAAQVTRSPGG